MSYFLLKSPSLQYYFVWRCCVLLLQYLHFVIVFLALRLHATLYCLFCAGLVWWLRIGIDQSSYYRPTPGPKINAWMGDHLLDGPV